MRKVLLLLTTALFLFGFQEAKSQACNAFFQYTLGNCPQVSFFDGSNAPLDTIVAWNWNFGDGNVTNTQNPTHTYTQNGTYSVCLTIVTSQQCVNTYCDSIQITCIQSATCGAFYQASLGQCPTVAFFDGSTASPGTVNSWSWSFGDGNTSTSQNPSHTYSSNGAYGVCLQIGTSDSCFDVFCDTINITCIQSGTCQAGFQIMQSLCPTVDFFDASSSSPGQVNGWFWNFGDGNTSSSASPSHTYTANGSYTVCLTISTTDSCQSTSCDTVSIGCISSSTCNAQYQYTLGQCPTVSFFDGSSASPGTVNSWNWNFGDGSSSTSQNPSHTYASNGSYVACLTIGTSDTCTATFCDTITINCIGQATCSAAFQYTLGQCPTVLFFDGSTASPGTVNSWSWNFGDGGSSTSQNPSHTYASNGSYAVCLTIGTSDSCISTFCDTITISCLSSGTCNAKFGWQFGPNGCPTVVFQDSSTASSGSISSWAWDFGDGNTSSFAFPFHSYTSNGTYTVCLIITSSTGCKDTVCDTIGINCISNPSCQAAFQWGFGSNGCPAVDFFDASSSTAGAITNYSWNFGDGSSSSAASPSHTYTSNGTYVACLSITTQQGCTSTVCDTIIISCITQPGCSAGFQWSFSVNGCPSVIFSDASSSSPGSVTSWSWQFGDGSSSSAQNPSHTYQQNGTYAACLTIFTSDSCTSTYCDTIIINCIGGSSCTAIYQWTFGVNGCPTVDFFDGSTASPGTVTSWSYDFGDGNTSTMQNPTHTYAANGSYLACLSIVTSDSCTKTFCDTIVVNCITQTSCDADFVWAFSPNGCPVVMFTDSSNAIGSTIVSWFWDFGDGVTDTTQNPTHIYTNDGTYNACLIITTSDQCMDTICDTVVINCLNSIDATLGEQLGVKVFPNPADDVAHVSFELPNAMEVSWELTAIDGRILYNDNVGLLTAGNGKFTVPVDQLPAGLYFIRIQFGEGSVVQKVMTD